MGAANEGYALETKLFPQGEPATLRNMLAAVEHNSFPSLNHPQIDKHSTLHLHGTETSNNESLVRMLSLLLFDQQEAAKSPKLVCSSGILYFDEIASK